MRLAVAVLSLSFVFAIALGALGVIAPRGSGVALGASTTLTILSRPVEVSLGGGAFAPAEDGAVLGPGDAIRTGPEGRAVLTYFEGSTVSIEPGSELTIDEAESGADGSAVVAMTQNVGRTWHVVTRLVTGRSRYEVRTPSSTASVRGTAFEIELVVEAGEIVAVVSTTEGEVVAAKPPTTQAPQPEQVVVAAGFQANVKRAAPIEPPKPKPEPERKVTVDADVVVDSLGRFNGRTADGKVVLQTPGAKIEGGKIVLPNLPDGKLSTIVHRPRGQPSGVEVTRTVRTTVEERGKDPVEVEERVRIGTAERTVTGVEVKRSESGKAPEIRKLEEDEKRRLPTGKVGQVPTPQRRAEPPRGKPAGPQEARRTDAPGQLRQGATATQRREEPKKDEQKTEEPKRNGSPPPGGPGGAPTATGVPGQGQGRGFVPQIGPLVQRTPPEAARTREPEQKDESEKKDASTSPPTRRSVQTSPPPQPRVAPPTLRGATPRVAPPEPPRVERPEPPRARVPAPRERIRQGPRQRDPDDSD